MRNGNEPQDLERADHPPPEMIAAYGAGDLEGAQEEGLRTHLETCEDCRDLLLLGAPEEVETDSGVVDFVKELVWSRLETQRVREAAEAAGKRAVDVERRRRRERVLAAAAAVVAVLVPLAGLYSHYESILDRLTRPQPNVAIHDVLEAGLNVRGAGDSESGVFEVPRNTEFFTLVFPVEHRGEGPLRVELLADDGRLIWSERGLEVDPYGLATLGLSRRFLKAGSYRIRVFSETGGPEPLEDQSIEIRYL